MGSKFGNFHEMSERAFSLMSILHVTTMPRTELAICPLCLETSQ